MSASNGHHELTDAQMAKHLRALLDGEALLSEPRPLLVVVRNGRGEYYQGVFGVAHSLWDEVGVVVVVYRRTLRL